ncbi:MAG: archease [Actinobacteria bacterium]|nr:MAG: archease [Actinomycetota bacterium]
MRNFEVLAHTADIGIVACGRNVPDVFVNAAKGMFSLMTNLNNVNVLFKRRLCIKSISQKDLLVDWLNELLFYFETDQTVFKDFIINQYNPENFSLNATALGENLDLSRHPIKIQIKACTYHKLELVEGGQKAQAKVYFDV